MRKLILITLLFIASCGDGGGSGTVDGLKVNFIAGSADTYICGLTVGGVDNGNYATFVIEHVDRHGNVVKRESTDSQHETSIAVTSNIFKMQMFDNVHVAGEYRRLSAVTFHHDAPAYGTGVAIEVCKIFRGPNMQLQEFRHEMSIDMRHLSDYLKAAEAKASLGAASYQWTGSSFAPRAQEIYENNVLFTGALNAFGAIATGASANESTTLLAVQEISFHEDARGFEATVLPNGHWKVTSKISSARKN